MKTVLFLTLVKIVVVAVYFLFKWNFICSNLPVQNVLSESCTETLNFFTIPFISGKEVL